MPLRVSRAWLRAHGIDPGPRVLPERRASDPFPKPPDPRRFDPVAEFVGVWRLIDGPPLVGKPFTEQEHRPVPGRQFRLDYAHVAAKVAVEIQGGTWIAGGGGHNTGAGMTKDAEKFCLLAANGWLVFPLTSDMLRMEALKWARLIAVTIAARLPEQAEGATAAKP